MVGLPRGNGARLSINKPPYPTARDNKNKSRSVPEHKRMTNAAAQDSAATIPPNATLPLGSCACNSAASAPTGAHPHQCQWVVGRRGKGVTAVKSDEFAFVKPQSNKCVVGTDRGKLHPSRSPSWVHCVHAIPRQPQLAIGRLCKKLKVGSADEALHVMSARRDKRNSRRLTRRKRSVDVPNCVA